MLRWLFNIICGLTNFFIFSPPKKMSVKFILLADDDVDDQMLFQDAVDEIAGDIRIRTVYSGEQLMRLLTRSDAVLPDLIFLDLNMPMKSGHECLEEIRSNDKLKHIPVAIFSTSVSNADVDKSMYGGANVYIRKPGNFSKLKDVISKVIRMKWDYPFSPPSRDIFLISF